jgi:hypothetical protein
LAHGLENGDSIEDIAEFLCRDLDEVRTKADELKFIGRRAAKLT